MAEEAGKSINLTAVIERDGSWYVASCPQLDVSSQGKTVEEARTNLEEAVTLLLEHADKREIKRRLRTEVYITQFEAVVG
jgi:predicted RNase H-like HicB family nuclease